MEKDKPRFGEGHMCAGCPVSGKLHTGCVVDGSVVILNINLNGNPISSEITPLNVITSGVEKAN